MKMIRVLPPAVVVALTASLAASPAWAAEAAAPPTATPPTAGVAAPTAVSAAAVPTDTATIPAFDSRFLLPAADAARVAKPGVLSLIASANMSCRFNGVWTDYSPALVKKNPRMNVNVTASIGCEPVANAMGDGSVRVQFGARVVATKALSWKTEIGTRPALPVVKFPSALKPPQLNALAARIAKTPGGVPVASPGGKASCRMLSAWWGYPSDAFPAAPRLRYNVPASSWLAVACTPVSNAGGSAAVAPANGAAAKTIAWGAFTPYNPPAAPIPAFEMTFNESAIPGASAVAGRSVHVVKASGLKLDVVTVKGSVQDSAVLPKASITGVYVDKGDPGKFHVMVDAMPKTMKAGEAGFVLGYDDGALKVAELARVEKTWLDVPGGVAPKMPDVLVPMPAAPAGAAAPTLVPEKGLLKAEWVSPTGVAAVAPAVVTDAGGAAAGAKTGAPVGPCTIGGYQERVDWLDRAASPAVLASCATPALTAGAAVAVGPVTVPAAAPAAKAGDVRVAAAAVVAVPDVTIPPKPAPNDNPGNADWWRYTVPQYWNIPNGNPVRWPTPNTPIDVWVNCPALAEQACTDEAGRVEIAVAKVREGGGPKLQYAGIDKSTFVPTKARHTDPTKQGKITVTFTKAAATAGAGATDIFNGLGNNAEAGVGGFDWVNNNDGQGAKIAAGYVAIDSTKLPTMDKWRRQVLFMHELGHSIGLTHPDVARTLPDGTQQPALPSTGQIMDSKLDVQALRWGKGDLEGLKLVGSGATTFVPAPPVLTLGPPNSWSRTAANVSATVTTNTSSVVCFAYGLPGQEATWSQVPVSVTGPVKDKNLNVTFTGLTRNTTYGYRAKLMPTTDCNGAKPILPFTSTRTLKTQL